MADNFIFSLYYRWTVLLLITFSFIITCRLVLGNSFSCSGGEKNMVETHCYEGNVFTSDYKKERYYSYYPWVNLVLLVQAFNCYLPHFMWRSYEGGYVRRLSSGVEKFFDKEERRGLELCYLAKYILVTEGKHKLYTVMYIFFEACNYACSLAQTIWLVVFFDVTGVPYSYLGKIKTWADFRDFYFPSVGTCKIYSSKRENIVCLLPLNKMYMIMFLFLPAWYIFITILSGMVLIYRIALLIPSFRACAMRFSAPLVERSILKSLCYRLSYSDWFFLTRLHKAMADVDFAQMINKIAVISQCKSIEDHKEEDQISSFCDDGH
ncbi:innexin inx1-like [Uloborus diversus]|uniref:innexin inx1-like n=1 Tax=Uloborus diversus TaxID=327109 RepID=UPI0024098AFE|nr:innexin inx1-like [Uloborus diversus]